LTTRLLQTARLEGKAIHLHREECSVAELFEDVMAPFQTQLDRRHARMELPAKDVPVYGDIGLIATALRQLIDNAIKYSNPGTPITLSGQFVTGPGVIGELLISVHNEGEPIKAEDRERIFDRFYRSPGTEHRAAGTGLGLSITKKIAEAHSGRVWVDSDATGTTFYFALPRTAKETGKRT
jgi:two-component system sensor histidine kinase KdpD